MSNVKYEIQGEPVLLADLGDIVEGNVKTLETAPATTTPSQFVQYIYNISVPLGALCLIGLLAYGAYLMITSSGDPAKLGEAKEVIMNAIAGFLLIALALAVLALINDTLKLGI